MVIVFFCWHNHLIHVLVDDVFVLVCVLQEAVIDRDLLISPDLIMGVIIVVVRVIRIKHPEICQHRIIGQTSRKRYLAKLQYTKRLVIFKYLE